MKFTILILLCSGFATNILYTYNYQTQGSSGVRIFQPENHHVGTIDLALLKKYMDTIGYYEIAHKINNHIYVKTYISSGNKKIYQHNPYCIQSHIHESDELAGQILQRTLNTNKNIEEICRNFLNRSKRSIDDCTTWEKSPQEDIIICTTHFYNQEALNATLRRIVPKSIIRKDLKQTVRRAQNACRTGLSL